MLFFISFAGCVIFLPMCKIRVIKYSILDPTAINSCNKIYHFTVMACISYLGVSLVVLSDYHFIMNGLIFQLESDNSSTLLIRTRTLICPMGKLVSTNTAISHVKFNKQSQFEL